MNYIEKTQRSNKTQPIGNVLTSVANLFDYQKNRIEKAKNRTRNQIIQSPIKLNQLEIVGYLQGDKIDRCASMTWNHFDKIEFFSYSENAINRQKTLLFVCYGDVKKCIVVAKVKK